jgi:hypothetical protein
LFRFWAAPAIFAPVPEWITSCTSARSKHTPAGVSAAGSRVSWVTAGTPWARKLAASASCTSR